jgi:hypothetical protein
MATEVMLVSDNTRFFLIRHIDGILLNTKNLSKKELVDKITNLRDELDRYC